MERINKSENKRNGHVITTKFVIRQAYQQPTSLFTPYLLSCIKLAYQNKLLHHTKTTSTSIGNKRLLNIGSLSKSSYITQICPNSPQVSQRDIRQPRPIMKKKPKTPNPKHITFVEFYSLGSFHLHRSVLSLLSSRHGDQQKVLNGSDNNSQHYCL